MSEPSIFVGVDVAERRGCSYYAIDSHGRYRTSGWLDGSPGVLSTGLRTLVHRLDNDNRGLTAVGIDSPRAPLPAPRAWFWRKSSWRKRAESEIGRGRHCEVVVSAAKLANPQWTPTLDEAPGWMRLGFALFEALADRSHVYEIFPTASYAMLNSDEACVASVALKGFSTGPKDMLDAMVGAVTVREFVQGRGCAIGGGDGMGEIILPRPLSTDVSQVLLNWPAT